MSFGKQASGKEEDLFLMFRQARGHISFWLGGLRKIFVWRKYLTSVLFLHRVPSSSHCFVYFYGNALCFLDTICSSLVLGRPPHLAVLELFMRSQMGSSWPHQRVVEKGADEHQEDEAHVFQINDSKDKMQKAKHTNMVDTEQGGSVMVIIFK